MKIFGSSTSKTRWGRPIFLTLLPIFPVLAGCAVGPDFVSPSPPSTEKFASNKAPGLAGAPRYIPGSEIPKRWWQVFHNRGLDRLIEASIESNPTLQSAEAAIKVAYHNAEAQKGAFLPTAIFNSTDSLNLQSNNRSLETINQSLFNQALNSPTTNIGPPNSPYGLLLKQLTVAYTLDIWGQNLRSVEAAEAQTDQQRYQLEAAYLALTGNVVAAAMQEATLRGQIEAVRRSIAIDREMLGLLRKQFEAGYTAQADVLTQEAALAQALQLLPPLEKQLSQQRDLLTALAGRYAPDEIAETFHLGSLSAPRELPLSLPAQLVRQRPDIRAAEANVHEATAQVGVAIAARLPNVTLSANGGYSAYRLAQLFTPGTELYTASAAVTHTIFDGFSLLNKQKAAEASVLQADAQYRSTVIAAFQNVADALRALEADAKAVRAAAYGEATAKKSLDIVRAELRLGAVNVLSVLNAENTYLVASVARVVAEGSRLSDTAGLFMALGGGWTDENLRDLPPNGPDGPTNEQIEKLSAPVNAGLMPSID
ncbi:efflux transporter outer membrane subunit [Methylosinus sp. LW4]|uniref:efflux transporter outer membrane subunit n=1 Tax=Methylosinus sp. LW4 TaxID=136993 RepID=UPI0003671D53|nr:efflux transporter outer membrane subunit [Methylosinus sp. LW4]